MTDAVDTSRMVAPDLVEWGESGPRLIAGRRSGDSLLAFPLPRDGHCERVTLSSRGILWSWTVQRFRPKSPPDRASQGATFRPYCVGYVEFPEGVIVEGRIDVSPDAASLRIGQTMETAVIPIFTDEGGSVCIFAFRPLEDS